MAKKHGSVNADYEEKRMALAHRALMAWREQGVGMSMRALARACAVTVPTLVHYFGDRQGLFDAIMEQSHKEGYIHMSRVSHPLPEETVEQAVERFLRYFVVGWQVGGLREVNEMGLGESIANPASGRSYLVHTLEPLLGTCEHLLAGLIAHQKMEPLDVRVAALALVSPVFLALMHQHTLDGEACRPLDVDAMISDHIRGWAQGYVRREA